MQDKREEGEGFRDQSRRSGIQWKKGMEALIWHGHDVCRDLAICMVLLEV